MSSCNDFYLPASLAFLFWLHVPMPTFKCFWFSFSFFFATEMSACISIPEFFCFFLTSATHSAKSYSEPLWLIQKLL